MTDLQTRARMLDSVFCYINYLGYYMANMGTVAYDQDIIDITVPALKDLRAKLLALYTIDIKDPVQEENK